MWMLLRIAANRIEHPDTATTAFSHENLNYEQVDEVNMHQTSQLQNNTVQKAFTKTAHRIEPFAIEEAPSKLCLHITLDRFLQ